MRVLAFDTAATACSVAVVTDAGVAAEMTHDGGHTHTRQLMAMIETVLFRCGVTMDDLDGFGVTVGPGSFTGVRIGVSSAHGLAAATGKPAVGISSLAALAAQAGGTGTRCAMLDARRKEVYAAVYRPDGSGYRIERPACATSPASLLPQLPAGCMYIGSGAVRYFEIILHHDPTAAFPQDTALNHISATTVGRLAMIKMKQAGDAPLPMPRYVRRSDAERNRVKSPG